MRDARNFAALSPTLLARKGTARPAMRPQGLGLAVAGPDAGANKGVPVPIMPDARYNDDLGWNDMGDDPIQAGPVDGGAVDGDPVDIGAVVPAVVSPKIVLVPRGPVSAGVGAVGAHAATDPVRTARRSALADGRRAAFTLRLDGERHLRLRLAAMLSHHSAQVLLTGALDRLLADLPEVTALAAQVKPR